MPRERIRFYDGKSLRDISAYIVREVPLRLYVNGELVITIACTGIHLQELVWCYSNGFTTSDLFQDRVYFFRPHKWFWIYVVYSDKLFNG